MNLLTLEHFAASLNETFVAEKDGGACFVLVEARPLQAAVSLALTRAPFSLLFRNGSPILFSQKTFQLKHAAFGEIGIFLVPVARDRDGFLYQAVFN
ncbi:MAG TPA: hypothetical protein VGN04_06940 [Herbaspirillum sp.]|jgi:hypothetical protein